MARTNRALQTGKTGRVTVEARELQILKALALREHDGLTYAQLAEVIGYKDANGVSLFVTILLEKQQVVTEREFIGEELTVIITPAGLTRLGAPEPDAAQDAFWWTRVLVQAQTAPSTGREFIPPTLRKKAGA